MRLIRNIEYLVKNVYPEIYHKYTKIDAKVSAILFVSMIKYFYGSMKSEFTILY